MLTITDSLFRSTTDPLIHQGRHFGRTVHAFSAVHALLTNGVLRMGERADDPDEAFTYEQVVSDTYSHYDLCCQNCRERREHRVFERLLQTIPGLEARLMDGSDEEIMHVAELVSNFHPACDRKFLIMCRFRKAPLCRVQMTRRA
jgi:hypothetical protein